MSLSAASVMSMGRHSHQQASPQSSAVPPSPAQDPDDAAQQRASQPSKPKNLVASLVLRGHLAPVVSVLHSKDGSVYSASADGEIRFWRAADGVCKAVWTEHSGKVTALSRLGKVLVSGGADGQVHLWDTELCRLRGSLPAHPGGCAACAGAKGGSPLLFTGDASGVLHVSDLPSATETLRHAGHEAAVTALVAARDGSLFSAAADGAVRAWSPAPALACTASLSGHTAAVTALALSADEGRLFSVSLDGTVRRWDVSARGQGGQDPASTRGDPGAVLCSYPPGQRVAKMILSADGLRLWTGHEDGHTRAWSAVSGACAAESRGHDSRVTALAVSRTEELLASASDDGSVRLLSADTLRCRAAAAASLDCSPVTALALSKDSAELWTGSADGRVRRFRLGPAGLSRVACLNLSLQGVVGSAHYRLPGCVPANLSGAVGFLLGAAQERLSVYTAKAGLALRAGYNATREGAAAGGVSGGYIAQGPAAGGAQGRPQPGPGRGAGGGGGARAGFRAGDGDGDASEGDDLVLELPVSSVGAGRGGGGGGGGQALHPL